MDRDSAGMHPTDENKPKQKPRVALMGEFSAGKSTLSNLLVGCEPLPVRITATSVPPVWIAYGERAASLIRHDGEEEMLEADELCNATLENAKLIRLSLPAEILKYCDLIDMPGISDPNLEHDVWADLIEEVDSVVWCTHATQAWRQSEAAVWDGLVERTNGNNLLVVTQFDKLRSELDRARVLARVRKETNGTFRKIFPVSLLGALESGDDEAAWKNSGADDFVRCFLDMLLGRPIVSNADAETVLPTGPAQVETGAKIYGAEIARRSVPEIQEAPEEPRVLPKRVSNKPGARPRTRPANPGPGLQPAISPAEFTARGE